MHQSRFSLLQVTVVRFFGLFPGCFRVVSGLFITLLAAIIFASSVGPVSIPFSRTAAILLDKIRLPPPVPFTEREWLVVSQVRLPRVLVGALVGMALGVSGAAIIAELICSFLIKRSLTWLERQEKLCPWL